jgi:hypothetical protein
VLDAFNCNSADGNISIIPLSGTAPFMYSIDGGATYVSGPGAGYTFMGLHASTYQLRLKDATGCQSEVVSRTVGTMHPCDIRVPFSKGKEGKTTADQRSLKAGILAYPNPSRGQFQVHLKRFGAERVQLQVLDSRGVVVESRQVNTEQTSVANVNLTGKAKGLYLIRVISDKGIQIQKVIVQ